MVNNMDQKKNIYRKTKQEYWYEPLVWFGFTVNPSHSSAVTLLAINN